jgi:hypothetical protein
VAWVSCHGTPHCVGGLLCVTLDPLIPPIRALSAPLSRAPARAAAPHSPPGYGGRGVSRPCVGVGKLSQDPPLRRGLVLRNPRSVFRPCHCAISAISAIWHEGPIRWVQARSGDPAGAGPQQVAASRGFDEERPFGLRKTRRVVGHVLPENAALTGKAWLPHSRTCSDRCAVGPPSVLILQIRVPSSPVRGYADMRWIDGGF